MGIGLGEFVVVLLVAFLIVGPEDLPKVARTLARWVKAVRGTMKDISESFEKNIDKTEMVKADDTLQESVSHADSEFKRIQQQVLESARKEGAS